MPYVTGFNVKDHPRFPSLTLNIDPGEHNFRNLIITGRNGTGKTRLLQGLWPQITRYPVSSYEQRLQEIERWKKERPNEETNKRLAELEAAIEKTNIVYFGQPSSVEEHFVRAFLHDHRKLDYHEKPGKVPEAVTPSRDVHS